MTPTDDWPETSALSDAARTEIAALKAQAAQLETERRAHHAALDANLTGITEIEATRRAAIDAYRAERIAEVEQLAARMHADLDEELRHRQRAVAVEREQVDAPRHARQAALVNHAVWLAKQDLATRQDQQARAVTVRDAAAWEAENERQRQQKARGDAALVSHQQAMIVRQQIAGYEAHKAELEKAARADEQAGRAAEAAQKRAAAADVDSAIATLTDANPHRAGTDA